MATVKQYTIKNTRHLRLENKATGQVSTLGEILMIAAGLSVPATSSTVKADLLGVCNQTISVADALTQVLIIRPSDEDTFIFPVTNNSAATDNGQAMVLTNSMEVNNTHTTSATGIVQQVEPYGVAADKLIIGRFITL